MANKFKNYIFNLFPRAIRNSDSYKLPNGEGLLQRYLGTVETELDDGIVPFIENFMDLFDVLKTNAKYLNHLAYILGTPISIDGNPATYRRILAYAVELWQKKGTLGSYQLLFNLIGLDITIIEGPIRSSVKYDGTTQYDQGATYDQDCDYCSDYWISYNSNLNTTAPFLYNAVDPALLVKAEAIVCQLQPINAKFKGFIKRVHIQETVTISISETPVYLMNPE